MHWINWLIVAVYVVYVVWDGIRRAKGTHEIAVRKSCPSGEG